MIHLTYEMYVDHDNYIYHKLIYNTSMISIGCKPMTLSTLIWLTLD
jgi:predicted Ser/Thr protein kinase